MIVTMVWAIMGWLSGWLLLRRLRDAGSWSAGWGGEKRADGREDRSVSGFGSYGLSVIVPARNEASNLRKLLPSLQRQTVQPLEIIVADDGSTDGTAEIARAYGASVVGTGELPPGWHGKSWACWGGAKQARGEWLLFLDADTELAPSGLAVLAAEAAANPDAVISVQPYHETSRLYEGLSAFFNLIVLASVGAGGGKRSGAFGPCLLCSRSTYERLGGHAAVSGELLEHFMLGQRGRDLELPVLALTGRGSVSFRMYPDGLRSLIQGWSKSFAAGAAQTSAAQLTLVSLWLAGAVSAVLLVLTAAAAAATGSPALTPALILCGAGSYAAYGLQLRRQLGRAGHFHPTASAVFPIPLAAFLMIFARSIVQTFIRKRVVWRGRVLSMSSGAGAGAGAADGAAHGAGTGEGKDAE